MVRFLYYVAPLTQDKWNILFEDRPFIYDSEEAAVKAAHKAAERMFEKQGKPSPRLRGEGQRRASEAG